MIRRRQEQRITETSLPELPFDIFKDIRYRKVKDAGTAAVRRAFKKGLGVRVSTSDVLTLEEETKVLAGPATSLLTPSGLNARLGYFACRNMFIRGKEELRATVLDQFELLELNGQEILR